jgi:hypothetical protein
MYSLMSCSDIVGVWKKRSERITGLAWTKIVEEENGAKGSVHYSSIWEGGCSFRVLMRTTTDRSSFLCLAMEAAVLVYSKRIA